MTLFMTSCGGKKSSRNCGRIRDTTRASLGKPFRILQRGNPPTRAEEQKVKLSVSDAVPLKYSTYLGDFPATEGHSRPMKWVVFLCVPVKEHRDPLHGNNDGLTVRGLRVRVGGANGRAGFLLAWGETDMTRRDAHRLCYCRVNLTSNPCHVWTWRKHRWEGDKGVDGEWGVAPVKTSTGGGGEVRGCEHWYQYQQDSNWKNQSVDQKLEKLV